MINLNLPTFQYDLKKENEKVFIFDFIRKKYVVLTPEEWVRQHFVNYLIQHEQYPKSLIRIESGLTFNTLSKRSDIVVYDRHANPWMLVECKAPQEKMDKKTLRQVSTYNASLIAPFIAITNGLSHYVFHIEHEIKKATQLSGFPKYPE